MSLLWREQLLVSLAPGELSWVKMGGKVKLEVRDKRIVEVEPEFGARSWNGTVAALRAEAAQWRNDTLSVRIVLSNHFVRYALVPHSSIARAGDEELALARFHFFKVHGAASHDWDVRLSPVHSGGARLACAVDNALIEALRQSFPRDRRSRLASVQPLLMSVFNNCGKSIPDAGAWLLIAEPDRACVALLSGKTWHAVQNTKGQFSDAKAWIALVERERWRVNLNTVPDIILVHATQAPSLSDQTHGAWKLIALQPNWPTGLLPSRDCAYATAICAA